MSRPRTTAARWRAGPLDRRLAGPMCRRASQGGVGRVMSGPPGGGKRSGTRTRAGGGGAGRGRCRVRRHRASAAPARRGRAGPNGSRPGPAATAAAPGRRRPEGPSEAAGDGGRGSSRSVSTTISGKPRRRRSVRAASPRGSSSGEKRHHQRAGRQRGARDPVQVGGDPAVVAGLEQEFGDPVELPIAVGRTEPAQRPAQDDDPGPVAHLAGTRPPASPRRARPGPGSGPRRRPRPGRTRRS